MELTNRQALATTLRPAILLVEDHEAYRDIVQSSLAISLPGIDVEVAAGIEEAITLLRNGGIELVIADMTLPDGSAIDLVVQAQSLSGGAPPFIVFSNHSVSDLTPLLVSQGVSAILAKEQGLKALAQAVVSVCPSLANV